MLGHKSMEISERNDIMVWNVIGAAVLNIALNVVLVPRLGWQIAAYATFFSYLAYTASTWVVARRLLPWDIRFRRLGFYVGMSALAVEIARLTTPVLPSGPIWHLIIDGSEFSAIYYGTVLIFRGTNRGFRSMFVRSLWHTVATRRMRL